MYGTEFHGSLAIACAGKEEASIVATPYGEMRSRNGAKLKYTANDAFKFHQKVLKKNPLGERANVYLENPTKQEVESAIECIRGILAANGGGGFYFFFAGHGIPGTGDLVLTNENLTSQEVLEMIDGTNDEHDTSITADIHLDSCYSGNFLIDIVLELEKETYDLYITDMYASSMYDERSWELSFLEHGAYSFTLLHPGNQYVNGKELVAAIEKNDHKMIAKYTQGVIAMKAPPIPYLTQARQHSLNIYKQNLMPIDCYGDIILSDLEQPVTRASIIEAINSKRTSFLESIGKEV